MTRYSICTFSILGLTLVACGDDANNTTTFGSNTEGSATMSSSATATDTSETDTTPTSTSASTDSVGSDAGTTATTTDTGTASGVTDSGPTGTGTATDTDTSSSTGTMTATDTSTGTASGSSGGMVEPCDTAMAVLQPVPPNIMLVLDKSGSMVTNSWDHDADGMTPTVTRWFSLHAVVDFIVNTFEAQINFGAVLFPAANASGTFDASACIVSATPEVGVAPMNAAAIVAAIPVQNANSMVIKGGTPSAAGMTTALTHLKSKNPANPRAVIFITDGAANCGSGLMGNALFNQYDDNLHTIVSDAWTNDMIPTYVVGIDIANMTSPMTVDGNPDNVNPYAKLNQLAMEGGKPKAGAESFYQSNNQIELQAAMDAIIASTLSCTVPLNPQPPFPELMEVWIGGMQVPEVVDCQTEDGWIYTNPNGPYNSIELCGSWCDSLKMTGQMQAKYFCEPG